MPCPDTTHVYCVRCHRRRPARLRACCCGCRRRSRLPADAVAELCRQWSGLPSNVARRFRATMTPAELRAAGGMDELVSVGFWFLLRAARNFDPARGFQFSTLAFTCVLRGIAMHAKKKRPSFRPLEYEPGDDGAGMDKATGAIDARARVAELMRYLSPRQRRIIKARFFQGRELYEIGQELGVCRERVRQIEKAAIGRMRGAAH
jgi:RNA polymerase sigma factor (sigma-70 family)